jgi:hypothetical protein
MIRFLLAIALVASVSTASAQQASSGQYVHCHARGCQNTDTYPGRCTGGRKCQGPDEKYVNGVLVKRTIQTGHVTCGDRGCRRTP